MFCWVFMYWQIEQPIHVNVPSLLQGSFLYTPTNSLWTSWSLSDFSLRYLIAGVSDICAFKVESMRSKCQNFYVVCCIS